MSIPMDVAAPVTAEPTAKMAIATSMTLRLPKISAKRPLRGKMAVHDKVYADDTQANESFPSRSWMMEGNAVDIDACKSEHNQTR